MQLLFDRGLPTKWSIPVDTINERITDGRLVASLNTTIADEIPDIQVLPENRRFSTVEALAGEKFIPINGSYNYVAILTTTYSERTTQFVLNVTLEHRSSENDVNPEDK